MFVAPMADQLFTARPAGAILFSSSRLRRSVLPKVWSGLVWSAAADPEDLVFQKLSKQTGADVTSARNVFPIRQVLSALERL